MMGLARDCLQQTASHMGLADYSKQGYTNRLKLWWAEISDMQWRNYALGHCIQGPGFEHLNEPGLIVLEQHVEPLLIILLWCACNFPT